MGVGVKGWGQVNLINDNFATTAQNPISRTGWVANTAAGSNWELRTTGASTGYSWAAPVLNASGGANVFTNLGINTGTKTLTYDNSLSTLGYTNIVVRIGGIKTATVPNIDVAYSTDGVAFISAGSIALTTTWAAYSVSLPVGANGITNLRIRFSVVANNSATNNLRFDDFQVIGTAPSCTAPSTQASALTFSSISPSSQTLNFTRGDGDAGVLIIGKASSLATDPASGTTYTGNLAFGSGTSVGGGSAVYNGTAAGVSTATAQTVTSLAAETRYYYNFYEHNTTGVCYNLTELTGNAWTLSTEPTAHAASFTNTVIAYNQIDLTYSAVSGGADGYVILRRADGTSPTTSGIVNGVAPASWTLPSGTTLVSANATGTSFSNTGLSGSTSYCYLLVPFNWNAANAETYNYRVAATVPTSCGTTPAAPSALSDITFNAASSASINTNITYTTYQSAVISNVNTGAGGSIGVMGFTIRDGGSAGTDADALPTILTGISFNVTNVANIRSAALFNGTTFIATVAISGVSPIVFTGLNGANVTCADDGTLALNLRVTFNTTVTDNQKMVFTVASATAASGSTSSLFAAANAGGAISESMASDINRIEVTADRLAFLQQPTTTSINIAMTPSVTIRGIDVNTNIDADYTGSIDVTSTGTLTGAPVNAVAAAGVATYSTLTHTVAGTGYTLTGSTTGLAFSNTIASTTFDIITLVFTTNDYRTTSAGTWSTQNAGTATWENWNGSAWVASGRPTSSTLHTAYIRHALTQNGSTAIKSMVIENAGEYTIVNASTVNNTLLIKAGGLLNINGTVTNNGIFEIEDAGTVTVGYTATNISPIWDGIENFHPNSNFIIYEWGANTATSANRALYNGINVTANTYNGYTAAFGNITVDLSSSAQPNTFALLNNTVTTNLAHKNVTLLSPVPTENISLIVSGTVTSGIGGDFIVDDLFAPTRKVIFANTGILNFTIKGNLQLDGATTNISAITTAGQSSTVTVEGDLNITAGAVLDFQTGVAANPINILNVKGDISVVGSGLFQNSNSASIGQLNLTAVGDGLTAATTQTIDIASTSANENRYLNFVVKNGAYLKLINRYRRLDNNIKSFITNALVHFSPSVL
jgi:hypothetical protein